MRRVKINKQEPLVRLTLDSGIFSAWSHGIELSLDDYIKYIQDHKHLLHNYVNFDVIPGQFGESRSNQEVERSANGSYKNLQKMKDAGLRPLPVFHQGEHPRWLERMINDGEDYIGISSAKDLFIKTQSDWLDEIFTMLTNSKGEPLIRTHGFGVTRSGFIVRFPWHTVDSTTWVVSAGFGKVFIPQLVHGKPNYFVPCTNVIISGVEQSSPSADRLRFENLSEFEQKWVAKYLEEVVGVSVTEARNGPMARFKSIMTYYMRMSEALKGQPFPYRKPSLKESIDLSDRSPMLCDRTVIFATNLNKQFSYILTQADANNRLLSFYELRKKSSKILERYVMTGSHGEYVKRTPRANWDWEGYLSFRRLSLYERLRLANEEDRVTDEVDDSQPGFG